MNCPICDTSLNMNSVRNPESNLLVICNFCPNKPHYIFARTPVRGSEWIDGVVYTISQRYDKTLRQVFQTMAANYPLLYDVIRRKFHECHPGIL